jgi:hypothetical protein
MSITNKQNWNLIDKVFDNFLFNINFKSIKNMKPEIKKICNKCGNECKIDEKQSNENWKVYENIKKCNCGGKFELTIIKK